MTLEILVVQVSDSGHSLQVLCNGKLVLYECGSGEHALKAYVVSLAAQLLIDILHTY